LLGGFTGELWAFKAELYAFRISAVANLAELVRSCNTASLSIWTGLFLHFWTFFASDAADTNSHFKDLQL
jgi:hypothetical protein